MVSDILWKILDLQQEFLNLLESGDHRLAKKLLEEFIQNSNELLIKASKSKLFLDFNSHFSPEYSSGLEDEEFEPLSFHDLNLVGKFLENSRELKHRVDYLLLNELKSDDKGFDTLSEHPKLMKFSSRQFEDEITDSSQSVSLSMDIGGTFIKLMFKLKLESSKYYHFLSDLYQGYLDCVYSMTQYASHMRGISLNFDHGVEMARVMEFFHSVYLSIRVNDELLVFKYVPVSHLEQVLATIKEKNLHTEGKTLNVTGGGSFKFYDLLKKEFNSVKRIDEVSCVVRGINTLQNMRKSVLDYDMDTRFPRLITMEPVYPYIVSSVGSGTFFLKVDSETEYMHVSGTSISGGTAFGLVNYLLPLDAPRPFVKLFKSGTNKLDSFTKYPFNHFPTANKMEPFGLYHSLGNLELNGGAVHPMDLNKSVVDMISYNTGLLGYLVAKAFGARRVVFTGNYLCDFTIESIVAGFVFQSDVYEDKSIQLCFPFHGPYVSAIGCFVNE